MRIQTPTALFLIAIAGTSCSARPHLLCPRTIVGEECIIERSHKFLPDWVRKVPEDRHYLYYIGAGSGKTLGAAQDSAYMSALLKLIRSLGVVYSVESHAGDTDINSFLNQSIKGVPFLAFTRRAEIKELYFIRKETVATHGRYRARVSILFEAIAKVRYPKEEWDKFQRRLESVEISTLLGR